MLPARSISPVASSANTSPVVEEKVPVEPPVMSATGFEPVTQYAAASYAKLASSARISTSNVSVLGQAPLVVNVMV